MNLVIAALLMVALFATAQPAAARAAVLNFDRNTPYVPGEVVLGFSSADARAISAQAAALAGTVNAQVVKQYANLALLSFSEGADVAALSAQLSRVPGVAFAEPNYISWIPEDGNYVSANRDSKLTEITRVLPDGSRLTIPANELLSMRSKRAGLVTPTFPNDIFNNWGFVYTETEIIWPNAAASPKVCVADTGVDAAHPDLAGKVTNGWDFVNNDALPNDDNGHGTHVSGVITAKNNNGAGPAGISNGGVLAVKVLSAQGWGTSFDIAAGIRYCADNASVKVINLSLGGSAPGAAEYAALQYAINAKGKLVVAAAGNDSLGWNSTNSMAPNFPGGWASAFICPTGHMSGVACNDISQALLAVGASRSPYWTSNLWVDIDGDNSLDPAEYLYPDSCATSFSNFGSWVQLVAPGEDIYSTTPVSYPFWSQDFADATTPYDTWSGTSMAAPHVSGGAARTWSVFPGSTNAQIKTRLIDTGNPLTVADDASITTFASLATGYNGTYHGDAPFCWPDGHYNFGVGYNAWVDMSNSRYLNVARAMDRGAALVWMSEATTGVKLPGVTVQAYVAASLKDSAVSTSSTRVISLINLPGNASVTLKANKPGYTLGAQPFASITVLAGSFISNITNRVSLGPSKNIQAVLEWVEGLDNLDLFLWMPNGPSPLGVVGSSAISHPNYLGQGLFTDFPRARWNRDGGFGDEYGMESISIVPKPGTPIQPYYMSGTMPVQGYDFLITDHGTGALNKPLVFRYWAGGVMKVMLVKADVCDTNGADNIPGNADDEVWWEAGYVGWSYGPNFHGSDYCGSAGIIQPYADFGGLGTTMHP
jgi:subtilisin family serine protease